MDFRPAILKEINSDNSVLKGSIVDLVRRAEMVSHEHRDRIYEVLEWNARIRLGLANGATVDWSAKEIDWKELGRMLSVMLDLAKFLGDR